MTPSHFGWLWDLTKPVATDLLLADVKKAEHLDFDETDSIAFFKKENYKVNMCIEIVSNMLKPTVSIFDAGAGPKLISTSFFPVK